MGTSGVRDVRLIGPEELVLELREFCIQTSAQHAHRRLVAGLLEDHLEGPAAEGAVEMLSRFLAQEDFTAIRRADPELAGDRRVDVQIYRAADGSVRWEKQPA